MKIHFDSLRLHCHLQGLFVRLYSPEEINNSPNTTIPMGKKRSTLKVLMNPISLFAGIQHRYAGALSSATQGLN